MVGSIVLCYHAISPSWEADLSVTPERLERQVRLLLKRGYRAARFTDVVHSPAGEKVVAITFDDAFRSVIELALPILQRFGAPGTVFVPTDYAGAEAPLQLPGLDRWLSGRFEGELMPMSWSELRSLSAAGWEIGSHSASHRHLTQLDDDTLEAELILSKAACENEISGVCTAVAYPYGDLDARVLAASRKAGYTAGAALRSRLEPHGPLAVAACRCVSRG